MQKVSKASAVLIGSLIVLGSSNQPVQANEQPHACSAEP
jgi:hypothetical protein